MTSPFQIQPTSLSGTCSITLGQWFSNCVLREILRCAAELLEFLKIITSYYN